MSTATATRPLTAAPPARAAATMKRHLAWLAAGLATGFAVPFLLADVAGLQRDVYYGLYALAVLALLNGWMRDTGIRCRSCCAGAGVSPPRWGSSSRP